MKKRRLRKGYGGRRRRSAAPRSVQRARGTPVSNLRTAEALGRAKAENAQLRQKLERRRRYRPTTSAALPAARPMPSGELLPPQVIRPEIIEAKADHFISKKDSGADIEKKAEIVLEGRNRFSHALRSVASRRSLKITAIESLFFGAADSTATMARLENRSVKATGIGWKGWFGLSLLAIGIAAEASADTAQTADQFISRTDLADFAVNVATPALSFELYNVAVTRGRRVQAAFEGRTIDAPAEPKAVQGVVKTVRRLVKPAIKKISVKEIDPGNISQIAELLGISEADQDVLFADYDNTAAAVAGVDEDDDDDDEDFS